MKMLSAKFFRIVSVSVLLCSVAFSAWAETYVGLGGGYSFMKVSNSGTDTTYSSTGGNLLVGWKLNEIFAFEAKYVDLGTMDITQATIAYSGAGVNALASFPVTDYLSVYGSAGAAYMASSATAASGYVISSATSESKIGVSYGGGARFDMTPNMAFRLSYDSYQCSAFSGNLAGGVGMYSVTFLYSFGGGQTSRR